MRKTRYATCDGLMGWSIGDYVLIQVGKFHWSLFQLDTDQDQGYNLGLPYGATHIADSRYMGDLLSYVQ